MKKDKTKKEMTENSAGTIIQNEKTKKYLILHYKAGHWDFAKGKIEKITTRILKSMDNPYVNTIAHPTRRKIGKREPHPIDFDKIFEKAKQRQILLDIDSHPNILDLNDTNIKKRA